MSDAVAGTITYHRPIALPGVDIMHAHQNSDCWRVFHEHYVVCCCRSAAAYWRYRHRDYCLQDLNQMLIEPGETHVNTQVLKPADFTVLWIPPAVLAEAASELGRSGAPHFREAQVADPVLERALHNLCYAPDTQTTLEQQSRFVHSLNLLLERHTEHAPATVIARRERHAIERTKRYIRDHAYGPISLAELSRIAGLSRFHLLRSFARQVGVPPHQYQIRVRVEHARVLLRQGADLAEAALATGFSDQSHLTRRFRQIYGITPGRFVARP